MRIEEIKRSERKKGRILIKLEDSSLLRVTEEELLRFGLSVGMELDAEQIEALHTAARSSSTKVTAANMIVMDMHGRFSFAFFLYYTARIRKMQGRKSRKLYVAKPFAPFGWRSWNDLP